MELEEVKRDYKRLQEVTMGSLGWKGFQENWVVTTCYKGLHKETLDYKRLQGVTTGY